MKIYLDSKYRCHTTENDSMMAIETDVFDGKCPEYIEGFRFVPAGESWTRDDGVVFVGEMVSPWKPYSELDAAQRQYEKQLFAEYTEALGVVGVNV